MASTYRKIYTSATSYERRPLDTGAAIGVQLVNTLALGTGAAFITYARTQNVETACLWGLGASGVYLVYVVVADTLADSVGAFAADVVARFNLHFNERVQTLAAAVAQPVPLIVKPATPPAKPDMLSIERAQQRELVLRFLRDALRFINPDDPKRIPTADAMRYKVRAWSNAVSVLRPFLHIKQGRDGGTWVNQCTIAELFTAINDRSLPLPYQSDVSENATDET